MVIYKTKEPNLGPTLRISDDSILDHLDPDHLH